MGQSRFDECLFQKSHSCVYKPTMGVKCPSKYIASGVFWLGCYCLFRFPLILVYVDYGVGISEVWTWMEGYCNADKEGCKRSSFGPSTNIVMLIK